MLWYCRIGLQQQLKPQAGNTVALFAEMCFIPTRTRAQNVASCRHVPGGQSVQFTAPDRLYWPIGQATAWLDVEPSGHTYPGLQFPLHVLLVWPPVAPYEPATQGPATRTTGLNHGRFLPTRRIITFRAVHSHSFVDLPYLCRTLSKGPQRHRTGLEDTTSSYQRRPDCTAPQHSCCTVGCCQARTAQPDM